MTKTCTKCLQTKSEEDFEFDYRKEGRRKSRCRECLLEYARRQALRYYKENTEDRKEYAREAWKCKGYRKYKKAACEHCNFVAIHPCQLDVDHIDGNHKNNNINNLQTLCSNCHRLKTFVNRDMLRKGSVG